VAGPGGVEAGRAHLKVATDTSSIPAHVRKVAEEIERKVKIRLPVGLDRDSVREEINRWAAQIKEQARKIPAAKVPVAKPEMDEWSKRVRADVLKLQRSIDVTLPVTAEAEQLRRDVASKVRAVEAGLNVGVPVELEGAASFRRETLDIVAEIEAIAKASHPVVEIETDVDRDSARKTATAIGRQVSSVRDLTTVSSQLALSAGKAGAALATFGPPLIIAAGAAAAIAPALLTAVPAVAGLGAGLGVVALATQGIGDALKLAFDPEKTKEYQAALERLSPAARGVVTAVVALKKPFKDLQQTVQETLLQGVGPALQRTGKRIITSLTPTLTQVSEKLNSAAKGMLQFVGSGRTLKLVDQLIRRSTLALQPLGGAFKSVTTALLQIGVAAGPALKILSTALAGAASRFAAWVAQASKSGQLTKLISSAATLLVRVLGSMGRWIGQVVGLLISIGPAAVDVFTAVVDAAAGLLGWFRKLGPVISKNKAIFAAAGIALLTLVSPAYAVVAAVIATIVAFQKFGPQIMAAIEPFVAGFSQAWTVLVGAFQTALPIVQQAITYVVTSLQSLAPQVQAVAGAFINFFRSMAPIVQQIVAVFVEKWPEIQATVKSVFDSVVSIVRSSLSIAATYIRTVTTAITTLWNSGFGKVIIGITKGALTLVLGVIRGAFQVIAGLFQTVASVLKGDWKGAWDGIKRIVSGAKTAIVAVVKGMWEGIKGVFAGAKDFLYNIGRDIVAGLKNGIIAEKDRAVQAAKDVAAGVKDAVAGFLLIKSPSKVMVKLGKWIVVGLAQGITKSRSSLQSALKQITNLVLKSGDKAAIHAVRAVDDALLRRAKVRDALVGRLERAQKKLTDLQKQARDYAAQTKANVVEGANITTLKDVFGQTSLKSITGGLQAAVSKARTFASVITRLKTLGLKGTALDQLIQAGPENGLAAAQAILAGGRAAIAQVNRLQKQLADAGGLVGKIGAKTLYGSGIEAAKGLVDGIKDRIGDITDVMRRIAREMVRTIRRELKIKSPSRVMREQGRWVPQGLALGIRDDAGFVTSAMSGLVPRQVRAPRFSGSGGGGGVAAGGVNLFPGATIVAADPNEAADVFGRRLSSLTSAVNLAV